MMVRMSKYIIMDRQFFPEPDLFYIKQTQIILYMNTFLLLTFFDTFLFKPAESNFFFIIFFQVNFFFIYEVKWQKCGVHGIYSTFGDGQNLQ